MRLLEPSQVFNPKWSWILCFGLLLVGKIQAQIGECQIGLGNIAQSNAFQNTIAVESFLDIEDCCRGPVINVVVPVELLNFEVQLSKEATVLLQWVTASESESSHFEVQRLSSSNAKGVFEKIGIVPAAGNSLELNHYRFLQETPANGLNYYRLKIVDKDSSFEFSPIKVIKVASNSEVKVFPNPTKGVVNFLMSNEPKLVYVKLYDGLSRFIMSQSPSTFSLEGFAAGIYYLELHFEDEHIQHFKILVSK